MGNKGRHNVKKPKGYGKKVEVMEAVPTCGRSGSSINKTKRTGSVS